MKKSKVIFIGSAILATCFGFTSITTETACGKVGLYFYPVDPQLKGVPGNAGWDCISGPDTCIYLLKHNVISGPPYRRDEVEPDLSTTGSMFMFLNF